MDYKYATISSDTNADSEEIKSKFIELLAEGYEIVNCISTHNAVHYIIRKTDDQ